MKGRLLALGMYVGTYVFPGQSLLFRDIAAPLVGEIFCVGSVSVIECPDIKTPESTAFLYAVRIPKCASTLRPYSTPPREHRKKIHAQRDLLIMQEVVEGHPAIHGSLSR